MKPKIKKLTREESLNCKLATKQIEDIRSLVERKIFSYSELAKMFGVSKTTIYKWANERNYKKQNNYCLSYYHKKGRNKTVNIKDNLKRFSDRHRDRINEYHRLLFKWKKVI